MFGVTLVYILLTLVGEKDAYEEHQTMNVDKLETMWFIQQRLKGKATQMM